MASDPYDIKFTIASTDYGFMLVSPEGMSKQLSVAEVGVPEVARVSNASGATHQDFDPRFDTPFSMDSFDAGSGQALFDNFDENAVWWAPGVVTHVEGKAYLAPPVSSLALTSATTQVNGFYTYTTSAGARYDFCWSGTRLYRRDAANKTNPWGVAYTHASQNVTDFTVFNAKGVIAVAGDTSTADFLNVTANLTSGTMTTSAANHTPFSSGTKPKFFKAIRGTLYALVDNSKVFYTVDPTIDGWIGPIETTVGAGDPKVGDGTYAFTNVVAASDYIFTFSYDAGYNIDSEQNVSEIFAQWKDKPATTNFDHVAVNSLDSTLIFGAGNEVYTYDPQTGATAPMGLSKQSGFSVQNILGVAAGNQFAYVLATVRVATINSASSVALFRCYKMRGARWGFEVLWEDTAVTETYYNLAAVPFGLGTRLYWGQVLSGTASINCMDIPADWDETSSGSYAASGVLYTSISRAMFPGFVKRHLWLSYETDGTIDGNNYIRADYSTNNGATWTPLTSTGAGSASTLVTRGDYTAVASRSIALRFVFVSGGAVTPQLRVFDHHQRVRFKYLQSIMAAVRVADGIEKNNGARDVRSKATLRADLLTLRTSDATITYTDFLGNSFPCTIDMVTYSPTRHHVPNKTLNVYELEAQIAITRADDGD
ncbi:MAG: hypothetical protein WC869_13520 [Phycisphaerae bacterium]|jgi:hypothetical protein